MILKSIGVVGNEENKGKEYKFEEVKKVIEKIKEKQVDYDENLMKIADFIENSPGFFIKLIFFNYLSSQFLIIIDYLSLFF